MSNNKPAPKHFWLKLSSKTKGLSDMDYIDDLKSKAKAGCKESEAALDWLNAATGGLAHGDWRLAIKAGIIPSDELKQAANSDRNGLSIDVLSSQVKPIHKHHVPTGQTICDLIEDVKKVKKELRQNGQSILKMRKEHKERIEAQTEALIPKPSQCKVYSEAERLEFAKKYNAK
jgi:hypothetical protein